MPVAQNLNLSGRFALVVDSVFSGEECQELIDLAERSDGFAHATVNDNGQQVACKQIRNCLRWLNDDASLADCVLQRLRDVLPLTWSGRTLSRLNNQLKFLRYSKGHYFKPHFDGEYTTPDGSETSFITVQIYLNEGFSGGETTFLRFTGLERKILHSVTPKTGRVLIFEHEMLHEGSVVKEGTKYVIRTDVMYR
ncbi:oxidoreductase [Spizellomyces punctatus DAOM BR117]|uniref:Oxidoreductase n=1 Tax=Spizellomyces punctatus (strain DAOM BR117) TaxID=645134 RepID=A0A0L0H920_SPIPD|nr:oxidoreductase [Spizellomyces punctatus DAOM BR117]KNC98030.1 oxidoreductase [Spizellomyces punctatus DAOM BR117]|eukprot:XP_016606070.1 oxidoreductase [Spizellomyces punctatus DAOM BR117]